MYVYPRAQPFLRNISVPIKYSAVACATVPVVLDAILGMIKGALSWLLGEHKGKGEKKTLRLVPSRILN